MQIHRKDNTITGRVNYSGRGEVSVITLIVEGKDIQVCSSMCLPVRAAEARLVLACYREAFLAAEKISAESTTGK